MNAGMPRPWILAVLWLVALGAGPSRADVIFIGAVEPSTSVTVPEASALTRITESEVRGALENVRVVTPTSVESTASLAEVTACVDAGDAECLSGFSTMTGVTHLLIPEVTDTGDELIFTLGVYQAQSGALLAQGTRRASAHTLSRLLDQVPALVVDVLQDAGFAVSEKAVEASRGPWPWVILGAGVGVGLVAAAAGVGLHFYSLDLSQRYEEAQFSAAESRNWEQGGSAVMAVPYVLYAAAAVLITGGIIGAVVAE
jgi:hypothetical protein